MYYNKTPHVNLSILMRNDKKNDSSKTVSLTVVQTLANMFEQHKMITIYEILIVICVMMNVYV